jgi:hypothetical protein
MMTRKSGLDDALRAPGSLMVDLLVVGVVVSLVGGAKLPRRCTRPTRLSGSFPTIR